MPRTAAELELRAAPASSQAARTRAHANLLILEGAVRRRVVQQGHVAAPQGLGSVADVRVCMGRGPEATQPTLRGLGQDVQMGAPRAPAAA